VLARLAEPKDVSLDWLATGRGGMRHSWRTGADEGGNWLVVLIRGAPATNEIVPAMA
jgi:hypothetical protein